MKVNLIQADTINYTRFSTDLVVPVLASGSRVGHPGRPPLPLPLHAGAREMSSPRLLPPWLAHAGPPLPLLIFGGRIQKKNADDLATNLAKKETNLGKKKEQPLKFSATTENK